MRNLAAAMLKPMKFILSTDAVEIRDQIRDQLHFNVVEAEMERAGVGELSRPMRSLR